MQPNQTDKTAVTHAGDHHYPVVNTEQSLEKETFQIKLPLFEGPFDLLLFFIERDELDIQEISISKITDDFLDYIRQMNALNIELASEFIYVASTLMQIKARMLIPRTAIDEQGNEIDPKQDLIQKLLEYKKIKVVAEQMRELETKRMQQEKRGNIAYSYPHRCTISLYDRTTKKGNYSTIRNQSKNRFRYDDGLCQQQS